jgi:hypothetical protein
MIPLFELHFQLKKLTKRIRRALNGGWFQRYWLHGSWREMYYECNVSTSYWRRRLGGDMSIDTKYVARYFIRVDNLCIGNRWLTQLNGICISSDKHGENHKSFKLS